MFEPDLPTETEEHAELLEQPSTSNDKLVQTIECIENEIQNLDQRIQGATSLEQKITLME
jgi:Tfp pilus assembly protein PilN